MNPEDDDPEARIRELERPLAERAAASEVRASHSAPNTYLPPQQPYAAQPRGTGSNAWLVLTLIALGIAAAIGTTTYLLVSTPTKHSTAPGRSSSATSHRTLTQTVSPPTSRVSTDTTTVPGQPLIIAGSSQHHDVECVEGGPDAVIVSGVSNTVTITGHCTSLTVSGVENEIEVDNADSIGVSGFSNKVTYHTGTPQIRNSGSSNTVEQG